MNLRFVAFMSSGNSDRELGSSWKEENIGRRVRGGYYWASIVSI